MTEETSTPTEQNDAEARAYAIGHLASLEFMSRHLNDDFVLIRNTSNADKFGAFIKTHKLQWTIGNLERAYEALKGAGELEMEPNPALYPELEAASVDPIEKNFP